MPRHLTAATASWLNTHVPPRLPAAPNRLQSWLLADFRQRSRQGLHWRDLGPAYLLALQAWRDCWPQAGDGWADALAEQWAVAGGDSRLDWEQAWDVVQDTWRALASLPAGSNAVSATRQ